MQDTEASIAAAPVLPTRRAPCRQQSRSLVETNAVAYDKDVAAAAEKEFRWVMFSSLVLVLLMATAEACNNI